MSIQELELVVANLPPEQFAEFSAWFAEFEAARWDRQIAADDQAGRLDHVIQRARDHIGAGRSKPL